jgi:hypothetical protein
MPKDQPEDLSEAIVRVAEARTLYVRLLRQLVSDIEAVGGGLDTPEARHLALIADSTMKLHAQAQRRLDDWRRGDSPPSAAIAALNDLASRIERMAAVVVVF